MTTISAANKLFSWFSEKDIFCLDRDLTKLIPKEEILDYEELSASILSGLEYLKQSKIVSEPIKIGNSEFYVLSKSLTGYEQPVTLSGPTCMLIASNINAYCEMTGDESNKADALNIREKDINNLIGITMLFMEEYCKKKDNPPVEEKPIDFSNN